MLLDVIIVKLKISTNKCICEEVGKFDKICIVESLADMWVIESEYI